MNTSKTGREYLAEIKKTLEMPSRESLAWAAMSNGEKSLLLRNAKLEKKFILDGLVIVKWSGIQPADQQKIIEAAKRAAAWVGQLDMVEI